MYLSSAIILVNENMIYLEYVFSITPKQDFFKNIKKKLSDADVSGINNNDI